MKTAAVAWFAPDGVGDFALPPGGELWALVVAEITGSDLVNFELTTVAVSPSLDTKLDCKR